jgi:hypothetical protein
MPWSECIGELSWNAQPDVRPFDVPEPKKAQEAQHIYVDGSPVACSMCKGTIIGPRFSCIHCRSPAHFCFRCEPSLTRGRHTSGHAFEVHMESSTVEE